MQPEILLEGQKKYLLTALFTQKMLEERNSSGKGLNLAVFSTKSGEFVVFFSSVNCDLYHYAGNNPVKYVDPDGRKLFVNGTKEYMAAVQNALSQIYSGTMVNFDTGEVTLKNSSESLNSKGYELLSSLIKSERTNTIWLGDSRLPNEYGNPSGNSCCGYSGDISMSDGIFYGTAENGPKNSLVNFDPNNWSGGIDDNSSNYRPPYVGLSHELGHSEANNNGTQTNEPYVYIPGTTPNGETNSIKRENEIRTENHLTPRTFYYFKPKETNEAQ